MQHFVKKMFRPVNDLSKMEATSLIEAYKINSLEVAI
jgi:hypothetical protein